MDKSRKQREKRIRTCAAQIHKNGLEIGQELVAIRDDTKSADSWVHEYASWNKYLTANAQELIGRSARSAQTLIESAEVKKAISATGCANLEPSHLGEIGRLAPTKGKDGERGAEKDYAKLKEVDVNRVIEKAKEIGGKVTKRSLRAAVDHDLGVAKEREAERERRKKEAEERKRIYDEWNELSNVLTRTKRDLQALLRDLVQVSPDGWNLLAENRPRVSKDLAKVCDELAGLLRS